jgi:hypothetical protein
MTLMKSLLLGSAAGIVGIASAQAADLPTRKGAPAAEYVRICSITVNGKPVVGWTLPGSDTCFKLSGYVTGQVEGGNLKASETTNYSPLAQTATGPATISNIVNPASKLVGPPPANDILAPANQPNLTHPLGGAALTRAASWNARLATPNGKAVNSIFFSGALQPVGTQTAGGSLGRPDFGYTTRLNFGFDAVSNTAYGPLVAHAEIQIENGNGFDTTGDGTYVNLAYVTWAGITAGKAPSFFSFTGGGPGWANFFSPDQQGFNQPDLLAYTASFGGGFSASIAAQDAGGPADCINYGNFSGNSGNTSKCIGSSGSGTNMTDLGADYTYNGMRAPDIVANLKVSQGWGSAQVSGVAHDVTVTGWSGAVQKTWGWGVDSGVSFNLPQFGAGDEITVTGAYTEHAAWFSGLPDAMWGENGAVNGNGQQMALADTYLNYDGKTWAKPKIWSVTSEVTHHFSPEFSGSLEGSYGQVRWSGTNATSMVSDSKTWLTGVVAHWDPVKNLDFEFELLYQRSTTDQPLGFVKNQPWQSLGDGFASRFEVTRSW